MIIKRVGGKSKIAKWIVNNLPKGSIFVDVFGGSGAVINELMERSFKNMRFIYNDADSKIYTFFKVLQQQPIDLSHLVNLTPYSRELFNKSFEVIKDEKEFEKLDEIDKAVIFLIVNRQSFGAKMTKDWSITLNGEVNYKTWNHLPEYIIRVAKTWKNTFLENLDYRDLVKKWDSKDTVFYFDPPYEKCETDYYDENKKKGFDHKEMFATLESMSGSYCASYYGGETDSEDSELLNAYKNAGCVIIRKEVTKHLSTQDTKDKVTEVLIIKNKTNKLLIGRILKTRELEVL